MNTISKIFFKTLRRIFKRNDEFYWYTTDYVQYKGQAANDLLRDLIKKSSDGLMVTKFGGFELTFVVCSMLYSKGLTWNDYKHYILCDIDLDKAKTLKGLCHNAGFFPYNKELGNKYMQLVLDDIRDIDILGSYQRQEIYLENQLGHSIKVDLDGYYAPFLWSNPWTKELKDKRVLVIHPFTESIKKQYKQRDKLFEDPDVLPQFKELILVKAVQSIAGNQTGFNDWFEALRYMEREIDKYDFDIALVGCGAYGMNISAYIKRKGKIAIHLAGWTQMLFGIYGNRWLIDQPEYSKFINRYWIRPSDSEKPKDANAIESGCYW